MASWDDLVLLAFTEIRLYGAGSMQTARRLRALIDDLRGDVPEERRAVLDHQIELLDADIERLYAWESDRRLATRADEQGLGS